ncbi:DNA mismatch repair endonuclease MutL [Myxococcus sp. CA051A]|uniref:DNA mismatch repair protein MutL n=1 Tax=Myxococcus llanfairpwllgwyngyllgogerychwyrndrobwllllantysiliogogogochensis TaxID=2590453 RepID=A0A540WN27_9BACT|nr:MULTISPECIES: DNA mismatch repair endonuclease MutL [Myxococcus]NTX02325.1 DNA mismatch repair endonuclease MutL [Myxococcus sp. CA040A]NTX57813.1 DNA mismatch repair endonuclease MutL [Myxococcus sp. CA039A]NTX63958.1 DNA mismatch repair endonuclease MutL [Myxococcus sp. CA051A]TQF10257.1 DNA mismatch repair endonuclease MutL [Myxococcus llanfairpwllgwyngyllgogerychwyrndrobwllllantysiliogogogochensis]
MARIARLSDVLINKIAAGEVVERPASVVKELVENSLDAGSSTIRVDLAGGGVDRIIISDDGHGMGRHDATLCLERHATSKLRELDDLFHIDSMGFRGEAVPAIASVSRFSLHTAEVGADVGTRVTLEGGVDPLIEDAPPRTGTVITVEDLFFNVPARRKFLRRGDTELKHAEEAVVRLALANPEVGFFATHEGNELFSSAACPEDPRERIAAALGPAAHPHLFPVEERRLGVSVTGYAASPEFTFPNARGLYTFVNRRYVRDRGLIGTIQRAYQDFLAAGRQPVVVLHIDVDPIAVDVNVHPQKLEVRFSDARGVQEAISAALNRMLRAAPWLGAGADPNGPGGNQPRDAAHYALAVERFLTRAQEASWGAPLPTTLDAASGGAPSHALSGAPGPMVGIPSSLPFGAVGRPPAFGEAQPQLNEAPPPGYFAALRPMGLLGGRFHLCEGPGGTLVVLDPHAALERTRLTTYLRALDDAKGPPAPSLFGTTLEFPVQVAKALVEGREALSRLGVDVEPFGGTTVALKTVPPGLEGADARSLLEALARALPPKGAALDSVTLAEAVRVMACHAARKAGSVPLTDAQLRALLGELDRADFHPPCIHGTVVVLEMPLLELERRAR